MQTTELDLAKYPHLNYKQLETLKLFYLRLFGASTSETERAQYKSLAIMGDDGNTAYRFLEARKWKYEKAMKMIQATVSWREGNRVNKLLETPFPHDELDMLRRCVPHTLHKTDKQGHPVLYLNAGQAEIARVRERISDHILMMMHAQIIEYLIQVVFPKLTAERGVPIDQVTLVIDCNGVTAKGLKTSGTFKLMKQLAKVDQDHYPEILHSMYFLHTPKSWGIIWTLLKPFFDKKTREKIHIVKPEEMYKLKSIIDEEALPSSLGGTCKCINTAEIVTCFTTDNFVDLPSLNDFDRYISERAAEAARTVGGEVVQEKNAAAPAVKEENPLPVPHTSD